MLVVMDTIFTSMMEGCSGSSSQFLQKFDPRLGTNEGIGKYSYLTNESDTPKPYTEAEEIRVPLVNPNVHTVEFHKSFFTLHLDLCLNFFTNFADFLRVSEAGLTRFSSDSGMQLIALIHTEFSTMEMTSVLKCKTVLKLNHFCITK
jgi:hypothetical protein